MIDTNIAIYYFGSLLSEESASFLESVYRSSYYISVINRIELLSFDKISADQYRALEAFVNNASVFELEEKVVVETIKIRQLYNTKLPDAIIAASCIVNNCCLLTNNYKDFVKIKDLTIKSLETII